MRILYSHRIQSHDGQSIHVEELIAAFRAAGQEVTVVGPSFYEHASFGGESGATFRDRIRMAIAAGLSADDALKAATVTPAAVLGVTAAVGTIEVGKLANFVVVSGNDLFAAGTPIKHVFVEGRLY